MSHLIFSHGIYKIPHLQTFFPEWKLKKYKKLTPHFSSTDNAVIGWGLRPTSQKARNYAKKYQLPFIALEDGFLRSLGLGVQGDAPLSLVYDDMGIYYDTTQPSRLEQLILQAHLTEQEINQAKRAIQQILSHQLSKYNHAPDWTEPASDKSIVLVIDQTFGDMAVKYGQASEEDFNKMLYAACEENPQAEIWVKTHPDVLAGKKKGYLTKLSYSLRNSRNIRLITDDCNPISLLQQVERVYCVTSQMGFEALLCDKKVVTFGLPWYAGWGITDDRHKNVIKLQKEQRRLFRSLTELFACAYLQYSRYINPRTYQLGSIFDVIDYLAEGKIQNNALRGEIYCVGMSLWKRAVIKPFFQLPSCHLRHVSSLKKLSKKIFSPQSKLLVWSNGKSEQLEFAKNKGLNILRMEDGFIRSVGLGSNLVAPLSLVIDDLGIYFNAQNTSRLEQILQTVDFSKEELQRSEQLRKLLIEQQITKYNVGENTTEFLKLTSSKHSILVVGQVEDDASIQLGSPEIKSNLALLKQVRKENPEAFIIYKPHPDVVSGNRVGAISQTDMKQYADLVLTKVNILDCIEACDELHTLTSLSGFEALMRNKKVVCYGLPFYAGWGLTEDKMKSERRTRNRNLLELICATLIRYPQYIHPVTKQRITVEAAINLLNKQKIAVQKNGKNSGFHRSFMAKQFGKVKQLYLSLK